MTTARTPGKLETKAPAPGESKPVESGEVKFRLAHHYVDDAGKNRLPGDTLTMPSEQAQALLAQGYGHIAR